MNSKLVVLAASICVVLFTNLIYASDEILQAQDISRIIPINYNRDLAPEGPSPGPVGVDVILMINSIRELNIKRMEIGIDFKLLFQWVDNRLNDFESTHNAFATRDKELWQHFWVPVIDFRNHLVCNSKPKGLRESQKSLFTYYPYRKTMALEFDLLCYFKCEFDLVKYPLDTQECPVELIENMKGKHNIKLKGSTKSRESLRHVVLPPEWQLLKTNVSDCTQLKDAENCIQFTVILKRLIGHHLMTVFIPSVLVVAISWIAFALNIEQIAPRVTLGLTTILTLGMQFQSCQRGLPPVAYIKAIDIWCIGCISAVFLSLVEFAISHHLHRKWKAENIEQRKTIHVRSAEEIEPVLRIVGHDDSQSADKIGGIVIPLSFGLFFVFFWSIFG